MCNGHLLLYRLDAHFVYSYKEHILCICYSFKNKLFLKGDVQNLNNTAAFFKKQTAPHLATGCLWYCSSTSFTVMELSCNTRHNPLIGAGMFLEESIHVFPILDTPFDAFIGSSRCFFFSLMVSSITKIPEPLKETQRII